MKKAKEIWFLCRQYDAAQPRSTGVWSTPSSLSKSSKKKP
jgi:1,4-dihydroxy-2-naphthoyl-CoA synthase